MAKINVSSSQAKSLGSAKTDYRITAAQMQKIFKAAPKVQAWVMSTRENALKMTTRWWEAYGKKALGSDFLSKAAYSAKNISAPAGPRPDDLMNIRSNINKELGIPTMQTEQQNVYQQLLNYDTSTEQGQLGIMNQPKAMGVLRGEAATQQWQRDIGRSSLARSLDAISTRLQGAMTEAGERFNIRSTEVQDIKNLMLQFPDAGITFSDTTEKMASKIKKSNEKKVVIDMFTQTFGYFPEGMSLGTMNAKLAKKYKSKKAYEEMKNALEIKNTESLISSRDNAAAAKTAKAEQDKLDKEVNDRSKFLDNIVQDYIAKAGGERRSSEKLRLKEEARARIEARYSGWGWVAEKIPID